jgi:hypothetical protein
VSRLKDSKDLCCGCGRWTLQKPFGANDMEAMVRPAIALFRAGADLLAVLLTLRAAQAAAAVPETHCPLCRIGDFSAIQTSYFRPVVVGAGIRSRQNLPRLSVRAACRPPLRRPLNSIAFGLGIRFG